MSCISLLKCDRIDQVRLSFPTVAKLEIIFLGDSDLCEPLKKPFASCRHQTCFVSFLFGVHVSSSLSSAQFFGAVVTVAYGASTFFSYLDWKGDRANAATNTVPT